VLRRDGMIKEHESRASGARDSAEIKREEKSESTAKGRRARLYRASHQVSA